jgi:hypothetical protein
MSLKGKVCRSRTAAAAAAWRVRWSWRRPPRAGVNELIISPTWNRLLICGLEKAKS